MSEQAPHEAHHRYMTKADGNVKFVLMMVAFFVLAYLLQGAQGRQNQSIDQITVNTAALQTSNTVDCAAHNANAAKFNDLIDELVTSVRQGTTLPPTEQSDRVARYTALKVAPQTCPTK